MVGCYRLHKTLGEGASSKVKLGVNTVTGQQVAVKIMMPKDNSTKYDIDREITILKRLKHPHIVQLLDVLYDEPVGCVSFPPFSLPFLYSYLTFTPTLTLTSFYVCNHSFPLIEKSLTSYVIDVLFCFDEFGCIRSLQSLYFAYPSSLLLYHPFW